MQVIKSKDNSSIKYVIKLSKSSKFRKSEKCFIAEGLRICIDAMKSGSVITTLFLTENAITKFKEESQQLIDYAHNTKVVTESLFKLFANTDTPQGFLAVIKTLDKTIQFDTIKSDSKFIALENLQDPSNMGTILRTAEALKIDAIILTDNCCDIFSPKVVRGSMGAIFRIPFYVCKSIPMFLNEHKSLNSYSAVIDSTAKKLSEFSFVTPCVTIIGNEANGLQPDTILATNNKITIPMNGRAESLNASVAASIIMWEMVK